MLTRYMVGSFNVEWVELSARLIFLGTVGKRHSPRVAKLYPVPILPMDADNVARPDMVA